MSDDNKRVHEPRAGFADKRPSEASEPDEPAEERQRLKEQVRQCKRGRDQAQQKLDEARQAYAGLPSVKRQRLQKAAERAKRDDEAESAAYEAERAPIQAQMHTWANAVRSAQATLKALAESASYDSDEQQKTQKLLLQEDEAALTWLLTEGADSLHSPVAFRSRFAEIADGMGSRYVEVSYRDRHEERLVVFTKDADDGFESVPSSDTLLDKYIDLIQNHSKSFAEVSQQARDDNCAEAQLAIFLMCYAEVLDWFDEALDDDA